MAGQVDPFGSNNYGVTVAPIDWTADNAPFSMTYHGLTVVSNDRIVGRITSWNPAELARENALIYELSYLTFGRPVDQVPGRATGYTVTGTSAEMWEKEIEKRLAANSPNDDLVFSDLMDQVRAFTVYEHWFKGTVPYRTWVYYGCWLTSKGEDAYTSEGDARVMSNFTFQYVQRRSTL
jgi:hypothetical protein